MAKALAVGTSEAFEQQAGDGQAEHGVAEEFEPFVVIGAEAAVRERTLQQRFALELVAQPALQGLQRRQVRGVGRHQRSINAFAPASALRT